MRIFALAAFVSLGFHAGVLWLPEVGHPQASPPPADEEEIVVDLVEPEPPPPPVRPVEIIKTEQWVPLPPPPSLPDPTAKFVRDNEFTVTAQKGPSIRPDPTRITGIPLFNVDAYITGHSQPAGEVLSIEDLDQQPRLLTPLSAEYPPRLRNAKVEGTALVELVVGLDGRVEGPVKVIRTTHEDFGRSAIAATSALRFTPGLKNGQAVSFRMRLPVQFSITD